MMKKRPVSGNKVTYEKSLIKSLNKRKYYEKVPPVVAVQHVRVQPAHTATTQHLEPVSGRCTGPDILSRILILGSVLLTNGSGSKSCSYSQ